MTFFSLPDGMAGERRILPRSRKARARAEASTTTVADEAVVAAARTDVPTEPEEWTPAPRRLEVPPATTGLYNPFAEISAMAPASRRNDGTAWTGGSAARVVTLPGEQPDFYSAKVEIAPDGRSGQPVTMSRDDSFSDSDGLDSGFVRSQPRRDSADTDSRARITSRTRRSVDGGPDDPAVTGRSTPRIERTILPRTRRGRNMRRSSYDDDSQNREGPGDTNADRDSDWYDTPTRARTGSGVRSTPAATGNGSRQDSRLAGYEGPPSPWKRLGGDDDRSAPDAVQPDSGRDDGASGPGSGWVRFYEETPRPVEPPARSPERKSDRAAITESGQSRSARAVDRDADVREDKYLDLSEIAPAPKDDRTDNAPAAAPASREVPSVPVVPERKDPPVPAPERPAATSPDAGLLSPVPLSTGGGWQSAPAPERSGQAISRSGGDEESDYSSFRSVTDGRRGAPEPEPPPLPPAPTSGYDALGEPWRQPPAAPPTPAEVERYRQRLENRLLERYNNLPEYSGKVSKVTIVLSRPLETSMDGTMIRAEFDQLVYDPWGKRIPELEQEYFAVTFASGGVQQMRSDPSIRIGLDMEKTYSERAPLTADPFTSGPLGTDSAPVSDAFGAVPTTKMPNWWRPQGE